MGKYSTVQRKRLLEFLHDNHDKHFTTSDIVECLSDENISQSSIYRNLQAFEKEGIIVRTAREGRRDFSYQFVNRSACKSCLHMTCTKCGKTFHLAKVMADEFIKSLFDYDGFSIDCRKTIIYGICDKCK